MYALALTHHVARTNSQIRNTHKYASFVHQNRALPSLRLIDLSPMVDAKWIVVNIIGNTGVFLVLLAYFALSFEIFTYSSFRYAFINTVGSCMIGSSLYYNVNPPSIVIQSFWTIISLFNLIKAIMCKLSPRSSSSVVSDCHDQQREQLDNVESISVSTAS